MWAGVSQFDYLEYITVRQRRIMIVDPGLILLEADNYRVGLDFTIADGEAPVVLRINSELLPTYGYYIGLASTVLRFRFDNDGSLPMQEWYGWSAAPGANVVCTEIFYRPRKRAKREQK